MQPPERHTIHIRSMPAPLIETVSEMQSVAERLRLGGRRVVLVPTMGALHAGHLALVHEARKHGDAVIVTVFVNPTQFGATEDLGLYPRRLEDDLRVLDDFGGVAAVFAPSIEEMYPNGPSSAEATIVEVTGLDRHLCGRHRPGHFRGVTTVVAQLFNVCKPHAAIFGLKDAQQFVIVRRMVEDLHFDVDIVGVQTVREADGLALSSRNEYLNANERAEAYVLSKALATAEEAVVKGELGVGAIVESMLKTIAQARLARVQYAEVVDARSLQPVEDLVSGSEVLLAVAVYFGNTRLIDSAFVRVP